VGRQITNISKKAACILKMMAKPMVALNNYVRQQVKALTRAPSAKEDYLHIAGCYISKRFLGVCAVGLAAAVTLLATVAYPWMEGRLWTPTILLNSPKMASYTGPAKIKNEMGVIIYSGDVVEGRLTGSGTQYDTEGELVYSGQFLDAVYEGQGSLYENGVLRYTGGFSQNRYSGQGTQYDDTGAMLYQGGYDNGVRSGIGMEYRADSHTLSYYGTFSGGQRQGSGVAYEEDGVTAAYRGEFAAGAYEGLGSYYENGVLRYQGQFSAGRFEGVGTLYDGQGRQVYQGEFVQGSRQGAGTVYDPLGASLFSGTFWDGNVNFIDYLASAPQDITAAFGTPGYTTDIEGRLVLTYLNLGAAFVCAGSGGGSFMCDRILVAASEGFLGVGEDVTPARLEEMLGERFSSLTLELTPDRAAAFRQLSLNAPETGRADKYRMSNYYIKVYYDASGEQVVALECGSF